MEQTTTEPAAFEDVYREQRLSLIRLAYLLTGSREQAEDIVQSAFAAAHDRWPEGERRLLVHREETTDIPELDETWAEVKRLPASQRAVVVLRFYEDLPLAEIAVLLDRPPATVRSDLRRALDRLRRTLP